MADKVGPNIEPRYELVNVDENMRADAVKSDTDSTEETTKNITEFGVGAPDRNLSTFSLVKWRLATILSKWRLQGFLIPFRETRGWVKGLHSVPIVKDRLAAALSVMIHLPAIAGVVTLSFFIFKNYYIGKELQGAPNHDLEKKLGIQFAAKLMELFIVLSLSSIIFAMVRHEFTIGEGVPYGALVAGQQITEISFLWSKEFLTILTGTFSRLWKKIAFIFVSIVFTILALGASSLSATVMMPQEGDWRAGGCFVWANNTYDNIFPSVLTENNTIGTACNETGNPLCPSWQWEVLNTQIIAKLPTSSKVVNGKLGPRPPRTVGLSGTHSLSEMTLDVREDVFNDRSPNFTVVSMPHFVTSDSAVLSSLDWEQASVAATETGKYRYGYYTKLEHRLPAPIPIAHARCLRSSMNSGNIRTPSFPDFNFWTFPVVNITAGGVVSWLNQTAANLEKPEVYWFDLDPVMAAKASVGVLVAVPYNSSAGDMDVYGCMIDARWTGTTITGDAVAMMSHGTAPASDPRATSLNGSWILAPNYGGRAHIGPTFSKYLNPTHASTDRSVIHEMMMTGDIWTAEGKGSRSDKHMEAILAVLAVNGLARSAPNTTMITTLADPKGDWWKSFMPQNGTVFGPGGYPYSVSAEDQARYFKMEMETWITGYAFADNSLTMRGAMAVFFLYVFIVVVFSIWSIWTGITSSSWESIQELLALSLTEKSPDGQKHDPEALQQLDFMKQNYCIAAEGHTLRLRTTHGTVPVENRVKPNEAYE